MLKNPPRAALTAEEVLLWECARRRAIPAPLPANLDWEKVLALAERNRMQPLLRQLLDEAGLLSALPAASANKLEEAVEKARKNAAMLAEALRDYLRRAQAAGLETLVMKGLWLSTRIYGDPVIRAGADIDILVRGAHVPDSLRILEAMALGRWWPGLMHDNYYARHHLHQMRCSKDILTWFEVHWTLDHPYTLLTTDMEALLDRAAPGELLGEPLLDPSLPDLLLSLAVHLVKHAVYLPSALERPDLARIILADKMLIYYMDIAEVIKQRGAELDWTQLVSLARQWGAGTLLGGVLRVCREFLDAPVPDGVLAALPVEAPRRVVRWAMNRMSDHEVAAYQGRGASRFWDFLLLTSGTFILRPIRVLDSLAYFFPEGDYLQRRYGAGGRGVALRHLGRALGEYARLAVDTLVYTVERYLHARTIPKVELP